MTRIYDTDLDRNAANFQPLTPLTFLERAAAVFPDHPAIVHGRAAWTYAEFYARTRRLASALAKTRHRARRHGLGDARQHAGDARSALRRADDGRRAQHAQHAARCGDPRLHARSRRNQGADHRPRICHGDQGGAVARQGEAARHRLRRSRISPAPASGSAPSSTRTSRRRRSRFRLEDARRRVGRDLRSTTPPAPPAIPRASSITTAAPICSRSATCSPAAWASIPSICGRCRCSTATAGAFRGRSRSSPAPMSACARCARRRSSTRSPATR